MTLTVTSTTTEMKWTGELSETDMAKVIVAGLAALYPSDAPTVDFEEAGDVLSVENNGSLTLVSGGLNTITIKVTDQE